MNLLDNHAAYRKFREDHAIYRNHPGSVKGYLLGRKLERILEEIAPQKKLFSLSLRLGIGYLTLKEIIEIAPLQLDQEQLQTALDLYESSPKSSHDLIHHLKQTLEL